MIFVFTILLFGLLLNTKANYLTAPPTSTNKILNGVRLTEGNLLATVYGNSGTVLAKDAFKFGASSSNGIQYFEVELLKSKGKKGQTTVEIGLFNDGINVAYTNTGRLERISSGIAKTIEHYGPEFGPELELNLKVVAKKKNFTRTVTVGCGLFVRNGKIYIFYTVNGKVNGPLAKLIPLFPSSTKEGEFDELFPKIEMYVRGTKLRANFNVEADKLKQIQAQLKEMTL